MPHVQVELSAGSLVIPPQVPDSSRKKARSELLTPFGKQAEELLGSIKVEDSTHAVVLNHRARA